jgi:sulfocyanin SoxE-like protein
MSFPVPTRTAVWALPYALGMATLVVGCSKQERPDVAVRQTTLAAQTPAVPADTADSQFVSFDAASNTVTFKLVAGPFDWNGFGNGQATLTVPPKSNIVVNFVQDDGTPHSAEVASGEGPVPNSGGNPAIPRAYTNKVVEGLPQGATDVMKFSVPDSGKFRIICGVPGHATGGMWIWMVIDPSAKTPSFGPTPKS